MEQRKNLRFHVQFRSSFSSIAMVGGEGSVAHRESEVADTAGGRGPVHAR